MPNPFETLLASKDFLIAPGAYDALSARIAARLGARVVYMSGFGVVGANFGVPDIRLIGPDAMSERVHALCAAISPVPLIADGDNGHGGPTNVVRLVRSYEQAGAACIQLEDQVMPKRCGHMDGKEVVSRTEAEAKIQAAVAARATPAFKIIARTDARAVEGLDEALRRAEAYLKAGADILFVEAPQSEEELRIVAERFAGVPLVANLVEGGKTPMLAVDVLREMGYRIALFPITALLAVAQMLEKSYAAVLSGRTLDAALQASFSNYNEIVGLAEWRRFGAQSEHD